MLGLIRTTDELEIVCESDPALENDAATDTWVPRNGHSGCTVITIRALNDREMLRLSGPFAAIGQIEPGDLSTVETLAFASAMEDVVRAAFVRCSEGETTTDDPGLVVESLKLGPLIGLGSFILNESGAAADPT